MQKGGGCPGFGAITRRSEHQNPCRNRRARQSRPPPARARPAQRHHPRVHDLIEGLAPDAVIADKGYDADHLREAVLANEAKAVIPPKSNRRTQSDYDKVLYKERNLVERFVNKLKQFRRVATRYDKLLANYRGFVILAAVAILLK